MEAWLAVYQNPVTREDIMLSTYNAFLKLGFFLIFSTHMLTVSCQNSPGVLDKIKTGLEYASNYIETAKEIADLVSESLGQRNQKRGDSGSPDFDVLKNKKQPSLPQGLASAFFRLLGLDSPKLNAIAVNSAIFLAQMISTAFNLKPVKIEKSRSMDSGSESSANTETDEENGKWAQGPIRLILGSKNHRIQRLVEEARDSNLPNNLMNRLDGPDTECIRLLVCKASPIIWAAQRSLGSDNDNENINNTTSSGRAKWDMTSWLPTVNEFQANGDKCEGNHNGCLLFK
ncbi:uncharacterized protein LOC105687167 [Athalia rosae]|uniref:uncharacterized protein LOC105687167 n=1 Tax=Athalia rosae TaxID=37344 RepID=UPI002034968E|nr:uncharacterized protein LOC105687167 [Athalia rosae]